MKIINYRNTPLYLINKYARFISRMEAETLMAYILGCDRTQLYTGDYCVDEELEDIYISLVKRRFDGEPLQYLVGTAEFMSREFIVTRGVFIPRPETEVLVTLVLSALNQKQRSTLDILDLCTGCGNIAITLARFLPCADIIATDVSASALKVARQNAVLHGVDNITFYKGNLFQALPFDKKYKFDIIVCNPPYIRTLEIGRLQREVRSEPRVALDGGREGLYFYWRIADCAAEYLKYGGELFLEMGQGQLEEVKDIFLDRELFKVNRIEKDFSGIDRAIWINLS